MSTTRQIESARANGRHCKGPATPEAKLASSRNALKHCVLASAVVIEGESKDGFDLLWVGRIAAPCLVRRVRPTGAAAWPLAGAACCGVAGGWANAAAIVSAIAPAVVELKAYINDANCETGCV